MGSRLGRSVRSRATLGASAVVAVALLLGSIGFVGILRASLLDASARSAETRAEELAQRVESDGPAVVTGLDDDIAQVQDADGRVLAASADAPDGALPGNGEVIAVDDEPTLLVSEDLDGDRMLVLGVSVEDDLDAVGTVIRLLLIAVPLLVLLVAATTWLVVGRALAPVARIRAEVDTITADRLHRRVPVPASGDEVAALATTMNGMLDRLDEAATAQRRFVSDASHELRSPLATIRQHAELAQSHPEATTAADLAEVVHAEGLRLQGLVDALLLLARLDEGAGLTRTPVDLDDIALAEVARLRAAGVTVDGSGIGPARVAGDARLLGQLARNLVDNARRHSRGRVAISCHATADAAVLTVEDDGAGVPPAERERVFERFVRLDEARARDAGGSGLGLAIVRGIAARHGGTVAVDTSRWDGARFTATLPSAS